MQAQITQYLSLQPPFENIPILCAMHSLLHIKRATLEDEQHNTSGNMTPNYT